MTSEGDLESALTDVWENLSRDVLQSMFHEWIARLEWVMEYHGDYYINPH
jgi:hypothetical protein